MRKQKSTGINRLATLVADRKRKRIFKALATKFVNPGRALYLVLLVPISAYLIREVFRPVIVIDSFGTPKDMQELGITSETFANRVGDKLRVIESDRKIMMTKDLPLSFEEIGELPAIEVPGSKLDLKSLVASARTILGVYPKHISGDIVEVVKEDAKPTQRSVIITVYITQGLKKSSNQETLESKYSLEQIVNAAAELVMKDQSPYVLAAYEERHYEDEKALRLLHEISRSSPPKFKEAELNLRGIIYGQMGRTDEATGQFQQAIKLAPRDAVLYSNWSEALYWGNQKDEAEKLCRKAIVMNPRLPSAYTVCGNVMADRKDYTEAESFYHRAIALDPEYTAPYDDLGDMLNEQHRYTEAIPQFETVIELNPKNAVAYNNWADALLGLGRYEEAIPIYRRALDLRPKFKHAHQHLGDALMKAGMVKEADEEHKAADAIKEPQ